MYKIKSITSYESRADSHFAHADQAEGKIRGDHLDPPGRRTAESQEVKVDKQEREVAPLRLLVFLSLMFSRLHFLYILLSHCFFCCFCFFTVTYLDVADCVLLNCVIELKI